MRKQAGYTLLELIVTLLVIGVLTAIAIPVFALVQERVVRGSLAEQASVLARNANAIAASDANAGGAVTIQILLDASLEADPNPPGGTESYLILSRDAGNTRCRVTVAITQAGRAEPGPVACGSEPLALAASAGGGYASNGSEEGSFAVVYENTVFPYDVLSETTHRPTITGVPNRSVELGPGCDFGQGDFFPQEVWASYGAVEEDCDMQGGVWLQNYTRVEPDISASVVTGSIPDGFQFDGQTGAVKGPTDVVENDSRLPFTLVVRFQGSPGGTDVTVTFASGPPG